MSNRIYVYTVVGKDAEPWERTEGSTLITGAGLLKVGQTTKGTARARVKQQLNTAYPGLKGVSILLDEVATDAQGNEFSDHDVHAALVAAGINRIGGEWFEATLDEVGLRPRHLPGRVAQKKVIDELLDRAVAVGHWPAVHRSDRVGQSKERYRRLPPTRLLLGPDSL